MIYSSSIIRAFVLGGVLSPLELKDILLAAEDNGNKDIALGTRQDILFNSLANSKSLPANTSTIYFEHEDEKTGYNVMSSYVAIDLSRKVTKWLSDSRYLTIINNFNFKPSLKINIVDPKQGLVPHKTSNINFIASEIADYWYIYINHEKLNERRAFYPALINTYDIHVIASYFEEILQQTKIPLGIEQLFDCIIEKKELNTIALLAEPQFSDSQLPYYEGLIPANDGTYSMGIYYRKNNFGVAFLKELCQLAMQTDIGKLGITPYNSLVVKGIEENDIPKWAKLLGRYGINVRHSATELNWYVKDLDRKAQSLKSYIVSALDKIDVRTKGLSFTIKTQEMNTFTSVLVEEVGAFSILNPYKYNIYHTVNFRQNANDYILFKKNITKDRLSKTIAELTKYYFENDWNESEKPKVLENVSIVKQHTVHQCSSCMTIYDNRFGDTFNEVAPNTPFESLSNYHCPTCDADKSAFSPVVIEIEEVS